MTGEMLIPAQAYGKAALKANMRTGGATSGDRGAAVARTTHLSAPPGKIALRAGAAAEVVTALKGAG